ncbi:hypothetical protein [Verrucosispora sp. WMMD1129]|uniref:hypothetical protein n=1 Tax=Verrucosispora sp. WMMD1129 TaxID=3016093 RepID=UPI00249B7CA2|nr:hypothetical protein [Verrucosispora sp. WMMD1129]WFE47621.1 hypothetical protein O7624_26510 [Verrucosispora sp. WMMD1129]
MEPLARFESRVAGRNARVAVWPDRIEWSQPGRTKVANVLLVILTVYTIGISLLFRACRPRFKEQGRQMLAMRAVQSVAAQRDGLHTAVAVVAGASTISFRVPHDAAPQIEALIRDLVLGTHPSVRQ